MKLLDRHVLRNHVEPFLFGFLVTTGVLFTEVLKRFLDDFLAKGISPLAITEVLILSLGHTIALSVPMAVLVATLMAFGQMAADNEITALRAAGVHLYRMMLPAFVAAGALCAGMLVFNNLVLPESNHRLAGLSSDIARKKPTVNLEPGRWVDAFKGYQLYIGGKDEETDAIRDVNVYVLHEGRRPDLLVAPTGRVHYEDAGATLYIDLFDGEMHQVPDIETETVYRVTRFPAHTIVIRDAGSPLQRTDRPWRSDREMSVGMLRRSIDEKRQQIVQLRARTGDPCRKLVELRLGLLEPTKRAAYFASHRPPPPGRLSAGSEERLRDMARAENGSIDAYVRQIRALQVEIQKKYSIPVACLIFVLLGAPLAIRSGRSGMTMAIASSIFCFTIYYILLTGGEKLADRGRVAPWLAMWAANIVFGTLGACLAWRASTDASALEWGRLVPRLFRRRLRAA